MPKSHRGPQPLEPIGANGTGLRGFVFGTADRSVLVMAVKGTSLDLFNMGGETAEQDRLIVRDGAAVPLRGGSQAPADP